MPYLKVIYSEGKIHYPFEKKHKEIQHEQRCNLIASCFLHRIKLNSDNTFEIIDKVFDDYKIVEGGEYMLYYEV